MITSKQQKCIRWIECVLDIDYPYHYRSNFYDAKEFISRYYDMAKRRSDEIDVYRKSQEKELGILLLLGSL